MTKLFLAALVSIAIVGGAGSVSADTNDKAQSFDPNTTSFKVSLLVPSLKNLSGDKDGSGIIKVCNDSKMACMSGDTCCSTNKACPSDGVCP